MYITHYISIIAIYTPNCTGSDVVHSNGRLIPHEFPITDLQQISGPDGIGRINCSVSSGTAMFGINGGQLETGGVSQTRNGATATLKVNPSNVDSFRNKALYCPNIGTIFFYLFISSTSKFTYVRVTIVYNQERITIVSTHMHVNLHNPVHAWVVTIQALLYNYGTEVSVESC